MECAWISNFVILETEALLTFCQEEHGVGSERARAGAGLKAGSAQMSGTCVSIRGCLPDIRPSGF